MEALIEIAASEKMAVVDLYVRVSNLAAQRLYQRCGFTVVGRKKWYYPDNWEDALVMLRVP